MAPEDEPRNSDRFRSLLLPLAAGCGAVLLLLTVLYLGSEVLEGDTRGFDTAMLVAAKRLRDAHPWIAGVMRDLSGIGSATVLSLLTVLWTGFLLLLRHRRLATVVALAVASGFLANTVLKRLFDRGRPDPAFADLTLQSLSFPSGHASMSALVFLTIGALLALTRPPAAERVYILGAAAFIAVAVGISRVALGVHWATDVLGGWAFGAAWAMIWLLIAHRLARDPTD
jgi:undecaprenyl-diphosphatase